MDSRSCTGACETERGCSCWSGKVTEADLDARRAEIEAATIARRQRYMAPLSDFALAQMASEDVITGPHKRPEPMTVTWRQRLARWWRRHVVG